MRIGLGTGIAGSPPRGASRPGPVLRAAPGIDGTAAPGATLTVSDGSWEGSGSLTITRQWLRDGAAIPGAAAASYLVTAEDAGHRLSCLVSASDSLGQASRATAALAIPAAADPVRRYLVVAGAGQSNMHGAAAPSGYDPAIDVTDPRILLLRDAPGQPGHDTLAVAADPLCADAEGDPPQVGLMLPYARALLPDLPADTAIVLVIEAHGGSGFAGGKWEAGGAYRARLVQRVNTAMALVPPGAADASGNRLVLAWQQGENSVLRGLSEAEHAAEMDALFTYWRGAMTGGAEAPITVGEMARGYQASEPDRAPPVVAAIAGVVDRLPYTAHVTATWGAESGQSGAYPGNLHFSTAAYRDFGARHAAALPAARANVPAGPPASTAPPQILGTPAEGQPLQVSTGSWSNFPSAFAYQWTLDGAAIAGADGAAHSPGPEEVGGLLGCRVTASNARGAATAAAAGGGTVAAAPARDFPAGIAAIGGGAWYDFADEAARSMEANGIAALADASGNGRDLLQNAGGSPGSYAQPGSLNGRPAALLTSDCFRAPGLEAVFAGAAWSLTSFAQVDLSSTGLMLALEGAGGAQLWLGYRGNGNLRLYTSAGNADLAPASAAAEALTWNYDGSALRLYRNGSEIGSPHVQALGGLALDSAGLAGTPAAGFKLSGLLGEVVAVPRALEPQEIADLHGWLAARWAG